MRASVDGSTRHVLRAEPKLKVRSRPVAVLRGMEDSLSLAFGSLGTPIVADPAWAVRPGEQRADTDVDLDTGAADSLLGAFASSLALSPALSRAESELALALREASSWALAPCADDSHVEFVFRRIIWAQRELLVWASPERRSAIDAWLDGPICARAAALRWQLRKYIWPQCPQCTVGPCVTHEAECAGKLPHLPAPMRAVGSDAVGNALRFWHARSHALLDLDGCLEVAAVLSAAEDWARPLASSERADAASRLAGSAAPSVHALGCQLHNRLFPACACAWTHCSEHRARWQLPAPAHVPPAPMEAPPRLNSQPQQCGSGYIFQSAASPGNPGKFEAGPAALRGAVSAHGAAGIFLRAERGSDLAGRERASGWAAPPLPPLHGVGGPF
ncbi:hypothetical protein T492DRAFT_369976 [Pavlovales sp. CCMP2436]|nr:hypothetical protein T492DRAFT_369976 [Pavlovales sp. CCMP2436]